MNTAKKFEVMTCEEFFESYMDGSDWHSLVDDMYWTDAYSSDRCFDRMKLMAKANHVLLKDEDTWSYESFFWNAYKNTEKGLS
jgi:hypothetical protein